jgi:hypothetical protein
MDNKRKIEILRATLKDKKDLSWGICVAKPVLLLSEEDRKEFREWLAEVLPKRGWKAAYSFPPYDIDSRVEWIEEQIALLEKL